MRGDQFLHTAEFLSFAGFFCRSFCNFVRSSGMLGRPARVTIMVNLFNQRHQWVADQWTC